MWEAPSPRGEEDWVPPGPVKVPTPVQVFRGESRYRTSLQTKQTSCQVWRFPPSL
jgi:hypothetical protein